MRATVAKKSPPVVLELDPKEAQLLATICCFNVSVSAAVIKAWCNEDKISCDELEADLRRFMGTTLTALSSLGVETIAQ